MRETRSRSRSAVEVVEDAHAPTYAPDDSQRSAAARMDDLEEGEATDDEYTGVEYEYNDDGASQCTDEYVPDVADLRDFQDCPAALVAVRATPTSLKRKRQGGKVSGKKSNKAHVKKRKFLRMGLALVDSEGSGTTRLTKKGSKATQKQHAFKTIENMSNAELTLWMRTLFPELPAPQGGNGQEARGFNWWKDVLQEDCFDGLAKYFGLDEPTMRLLVEKYQVSSPGKQQTHRWRLNKPLLDTLLRPGRNAQFARRYRQAFAGYHDKARRNDFLKDDAAMVVFAASFTQCEEEAQEETELAAPAPSESSNLHSLDNLNVVTARLMEEHAARVYEAAPAAVDCGGGCGDEGAPELVFSGCGFDSLGDSQTEFFNGLFV